MKLSSFARPTATTAIAVGALVVALGGSTAVAVGSLQNGNSLIKKHSLSGDRLKANTVTGSRIKESTLGTVPSAETAVTATTASHLPALVWHDFTLLNGWQNYGAAYSGTPGYAIDGLGFVHLRGAIAFSGATSAIFANLPLGFRPSEANVWLPVASTNDDSTPKPVALDVVSGGDIYVEPGTGANRAFVSLAGVEFYAG